MTSMVRAGLTRRTLRNALTRQVPGILLLCGGLGLVAGCGNGSGPSGAIAELSALPTTTDTGAPTATSSETQTVPIAVPAPAASPSASVDPGTLPQTRVLPGTNDPLFQAGVQTLWNAIVQNNPSLAQPFFFPETAYVQVKAIKDPVADYRNRLIGFYDLDIHAAHALLGTNAKNAKLVGMTVPTGQAEWIMPGVESNKESYYRVYGSRITYTVNGRTKSFGVFSLISWRGEWYVVHLGPNPRPKQIGAVYQPR